MQLVTSEPCGMAFKYRSKGNQTVYECCAPGCTFRVLIVPVPEAKEGKKLSSQSEDDKPKTMFRFSTGGQHNDSDHSRKRGLPAALIPAADSLLATYGPKKVRQLLIKSKFDKDTSLTQSQRDALPNPDESQEIAILDEMLRSRKKAAMREKRGRGEEKGDPDRSSR
ncbi:unnamed protein product [Chrysoparadoxa australica]